MRANWLPLNTGQDRGQSTRQQKRDGVQRNSSATPSTNADKKEKGNAEDEWATTSDEDMHKPLKGKKADSNKSLHTDNPLSPEEEARILPYMPALFSTDLPPCGPEAQVAYINVNKRLRTQWLQERGQVPAIDICITVRELLSNQNFLFPPMTQKGPNKRRKPWRREKIFVYELRWIEYFITEALDLENVQATEKELSNRKKEQTIPSVLGFNTDRRDILKLWDDWHAKKRIRASKIPEHAIVNTDAQSGADTLVPEEGIGKESQDQVKDQGTLTGSNLVISPSSAHGLQKENVKDELQA